MKARVRSAAPWGNFSLFLLLWSLATAMSHAASTEYQYDALGRLRRVVHDNGMVTGYTLDAAGNRTQVSDAPVVPPTTPASISVPASNSFGIYTIDWGAAGGTVLAYELYESAVASFAAQALVYTGAALTATISGKPSGTYYYRVRACASATCSAYTTGANGTVVSIPPPSPGSPTYLTRTFIANCAWRANWIAPVGGVPVANYVVGDKLGNQQTVTGTQAYVNCPINNQNGNKPNWVRACGSAGTCSLTIYFP